METINWLQEWYLSHCDGDWEHQYGISITTLDNPGWYLEIDLVYTTFQELELKLITVENNDRDWYNFKVTDGKYCASGDPSKLELLILKFKDIIENPINKS
jgi:hypothetical protein